MCVPSSGAVGYHSCLALLTVRLVGNIKACILPLIKISHMLQSDGSIKSGGGASSSAIKIDCCASFALDFP